MGNFPNHNIDLVNEGKWCFKHPDRLMLNDAMELIELLKDKGIEETLEDLAHLIFPQFAFKTLLLPYDIIHGVICGYDVREILDFWRGRA